MSKPDTWMPLYIGDYLQDTTRLSTEQHGAYLLLIMDYWTNGPLPDDDTSLAQVTRLQLTAWKKHRPALSRLFLIADGEWRHKRVEEEYAKAVAFNEKQKANGAKGGRPKKTQNETQKKPMGFDRDNPSHIPDESPSPSPSQVNPSEYQSSLSTSTVGTPAGAVCARLKSEAGLLDVNPQHPKLLALIADGLTEGELVAAGHEAKQRGKGFAYALATAEGRRRDAANTKPLPSKAAGGLSNPGQKTAEAVARWLESEGAQP